jgi:hypothetical protein
MPLNRMRTGLFDEFAGDLTVDVLWKRTCNGFECRFNMSVTIKDLAEWTSIFARMKVVGVKFFFDLLRLHDS